MHGSLATVVWGLHSGLRSNALHARFSISKTRIAPVGQDVLFQDFRVYV